MIRNVCVGEFQTDDAENLRACMVLKSSISILNFIYETSTRYINSKQVSSTVCSRDVDVDADRQKKIRSL